MTTLYSYENPVIRGFHPDPSICRVGQDFYLVTSTFEFFPGLPLYHSTNLVNWEPIGFCLTEPEQLDLTDSRCSGGLFAPTIRYHDGIFYVTCTNVSHGGNFIVHTREITGKWSAPCWVDQGGIDPSLFFDSDGTCCFCSTCFDETGPAIVASRIDPITGALEGESHVISRGSGGKYPEAPHIYRKDGFYYLMLAEGGTEYGHMETIFRSKNLFGPYEACPRNPILTHRDYMGSPIQATGHGDLTQDSHGNWWMVCLGIRPLPDGMLHNLGRETFLAPVVWDEEGWPVVGNNGRLEPVMEAPLPERPRPRQPETFFEDFCGHMPENRWNYIRNPELHRYRAEGDGLKLEGDGKSLAAPSPCFLGVRQTEFCQTARTQVSLVRGESAKAGIAAYYNQQYFYSLSLVCEGKDTFLVVESCVHGIPACTARLACSCEEVELEIRGDPAAYHFSFRCGKDWVEMGALPSAGLCTEGTMTTTFTGVYFGIFSEKGQGTFSFFSLS